jgi:hypothetical protein
MPHLLRLLGVGAELALLQCLVALPWALVAFSDSPRRQLRRSETWTTAVGVFASVAFAIALLLYAVKDAGNLQLLGKVYAAVLHLQLIADLFIAIFGVLLFAWPKGGAVALSAFREGVRQPLFWLIVGIVLLIQLIIPFVPYFTFGEDHLMARDLGLEVIMLGAVLFCVLVAAMSISEEIEGRTAVTLMSKPVSRRQFLLGKFIGILLTGLLLVTALGWVYGWMIDFKHYYERVHWYDQTNPTQFPGHAAELIRAWVGPDEGQSLVRGAIMWALDYREAIPGLILAFCHVAVLLAAAVCLATRLPVAANIVTCVILFVLGHLTPTIRQAAEVQASSDVSGSKVAATMLSFVAQVFELFLPGLQLFSPTRITDVPIDPWQLTLYAGEVAGYTLLYTVILLLFGLILFEDRDLA